MLRNTLFPLLLAAVIAPVYASPAPGTAISSVTRVQWSIAGTPFSTTTTSAFVVLELVEATLTGLDAAPATGVPGQPDRLQRYRLANSGNGQETFRLDVIDGGDFALDDIRLFFDTDGDGQHSAQDTAYVHGSNDPELAQGEHLDILLVGNFPADLREGDTARPQLQATSTSVESPTTPGTVIAERGDGGVDAMVGTFGGRASAEARFIVLPTGVQLEKSARIVDPVGGDAIVTGANITYTLTVTANTTAGEALITQPIPEFTRLIDGSLRVDGIAMSDSVDTDAAHFNAPENRVEFQLGDVQGGTKRTAEFTVRIQPAGETP